MCFDGINFTSLQMAKGHAWHESSTTPAFAVFRVKNWGDSLHEQISYEYRKNPSLKVARSRASSLASDLFIASASWAVVSAQTTAPGEPVPNASRRRAKATFRRSSLGHLVVLSSLYKLEVSSMRIIPVNRLGFIHFAAARQY
jgi:hypothetical protein